LQDANKAMARRPEMLTTGAADRKHLSDAQLGVTMVLRSSTTRMSTASCQGWSSFDGTRWVACRRGFFDAYFISPFNLVEIRFHRQT
jgi:hypothetical protein